MQPLQICIGPIIRIGRESWCLPYAGFLEMSSGLNIGSGSRWDLAYSVTPTNALTLREKIIFLIDFHKFSQS